MLLFLCLMFFFQDANFNLRYSILPKYLLWTAGKILFQDNSSQDYKCYSVNTLNSCHFFLSQRLKQVLGFKEITKLRQAEAQEVRTHQEKQVFRIFFFLSGTWLRIGGLNLLLSTVCVWAPAGFANSVALRQMWEEVEEEEKPSVRCK